METSVAASGTMKGIQVQEMLTFVGVPTAEKGVIHGMGKGVVMATGGESEMVTYTGEGIGRLDSSGSIKWRGSVFFRTSSGDRLKFLNNLVESLNPRSTLMETFPRKRGNGNRQRLGLPQKNQPCT